VTLCEYNVTKLAAEIRSLLDLVLTLSTLTWIRQFTGVLLEIMLAI